MLQITRALSQEILLEKLLSEVMRILLENSGADRACLLLEKNNGDPEKALEIVAKRYAGQDSATSSPDRAFEQSDLDRNAGTPYIFPREL